MRAAGGLLCLMASIGSLLGCSDDGNKGECDLAAPDCADGLVCEAVQDGQPHCVTPLVIQGKVLDATDESPIEGAVVQAVDPNGTAVGESDRTGGDGSYSLIVPAIRDKDGNPIEGDSYTLRAQAGGYQAFPTAIRPALPLDADTAQNTDEQWMIQNAITTIQLLPLPGDVSGLGSISGSILSDRCAGILVVAESGSTGTIGFSDSACNYIIFNVPAGTYEVAGYAAGVQLDPTAVVLESGEDKTGVDLVAATRPLSAVSGHVQIVNAPGESRTSVVLAVESTFVPDAARGVVPAGLRIGDVSTEFTIADVPDGRYVVLAAFENDLPYGLVRDPDQTIGGTRIVHIQVPDAETGNTITLDEGFKVTEALQIIAPGAQGPEEVTTPTPMFSWVDDSSEQGYEVHVFDAFGQEIWLDEIGPSESATVEHTYAGPTLEEGMVYQFRAVSFREKTGTRTAISSTEDLKGVFFYSAVTP